MSGQSTVLWTRGLVSLLVAFAWIPQADVQAQDSENASSQQTKSKPKLEPKAPGEFLKLVPANAVTLVIPNQDRFGTRGDVISQHTRFIPFFTPSQAMQFLRSSIAAKGVDTAGPILVTSPNIDTPVPTFAFLSRDREATAAAYGDAKDKLLGGKRAMVLTNSLSDGMSAMMRKNQIWLSQKGQDLDRVLASKSLFETMKKDQRDEWKNVDAMLYFSADVIPNDGRDSAKQFIEELFSTDKSASKNAVTVARHLHSVVTSLTMENGIQGKLHIGFDDHPDANRALASLVGKGQSDVVGLPDGNVIVASSIHGTTQASSAMAGDLLSAPFWPWRSLISNTQTSVLGKLVNELASEIDNTAVGLYANGPMSDRGIASVVLVLTPRRTPKDLIAKMRAMSSFVDGRTARHRRIGDSTFDIETAEKLIQQLADDDFIKREDAMRALRAMGPPVLPALRKAMESDSELMASRAERLYENIYGAVGRAASKALDNNLFSSLDPKFVFRKNLGKPERPIAEIVLKPGSKTDKVNQQLSILFGRNWKRVRFAVLDQHVVMLFGSETEWLEKATQTAEAGEEPLATRIRPARAPREQRLGEWHFSIPRLNSLTQGTPKMPTAKPTVFSTLTFSRGKHGLWADLTVPIPELKAIGDARNR